MVFAVNGAMSIFRALTGSSLALLIAVCAGLPACSDDDGGSGGSGGSGGNGGTGGSAGASSSSGQGGSADGGGGAGGGMPASDACQTCVAGVYTPGSACEATIQACDADTDCDAWKNCTEDCFTMNDSEACYQACETGFPHDAALSDPLLACSCDTCAQLCVAACSIQ